MVIVCMRRKKSKGGRKSNKID
uniref:Uncharacterized protein n=1 Tax=Arundo donax TaxID=35708 RepID=A0A0A9B4W0_ARUDO